jgi:hypothetical protein
MSTVSVYLRHISETTSEPGKIKAYSLRHDCFVIMATSNIFLGTVLITMLMGPLATGRLTINDISDCRKKIIQYELDKQNLDANRNLC